MPQPCSRTCLPDADVKLSLSMTEIIETLCSSADFKRGDRIKTLRGSTHGIVVRVLSDGRVAWRPNGSQSELIALPESLLLG